MGIKTVADLEELREGLLQLYPDAVRGSVAKSKWGNGRKQLHLSYWIASDTVGGEIIEAKGELFYYYEWDTNEGRSYKFAESEIETMVARVMSLNTRPQTIARTVTTGDQ